MDGKRNISRREFLLGTLGATGIAAGGGVALWYSREKPREASTDVMEVVNRIPDAVRETVAEQPVEVLISQVQTEYKNLSNSLRGIFDNPTYNEDPRILEILRRGTLTQLRDSGLFHSMDTPLRRNFLNPHESSIPLQPSMWEQKCEQAQEGSRQSTQHSVCEAARHNTSYDTLPRRRITSQQFIETIRVGLESARTIYPNRPMTGKLAQALGAETLLAITTQELMPESGNPMGRIAMYRALVDAGFEPNRIPAVHDSLLSFGLFQMTQMTYENGYHGIEDTPDLSTRSGGSIGYLIDNAQLPTRLHECVTLDNQVLAGALLQFENIYTYIAPVFADNPTLTAYWDTLSDEDKQMTLAALLGATHHNPSRASQALVLLSQQVTLGSTATTLRDLFISTLGQRPNDESDDRYDARLETVEHATNTSTLVSYWHKYLTNE